MIAETERHVITRWASAVLRLVARAKECVTAKYIGSGLAKATAADLLRASLVYPVNLLKL
jgi:hypothetical protein